MPFEYQTFMDAWYSNGIRMIDQILFIFRQCGHLSARLSRSQYIVTIPKLSKQKSGVWMFLNFWMSDI